MSKKGRLYFHDFATGEMLDAVNVVMKKFGLNYVEATAKIQSERHLLPRVKQAISRPKQLIDVVDGAFEEYMFY